MFSEFLRPNILTILKFILEKKRENKCNSIMIYTNNQGPKTWTRMISNYFDAKLGEKTFDRIISAFKVHGKIVEMSRTSHDKSMKDLIRCTKIENNTEICFLDTEVCSVQTENMSAVDGEYGWYMEGGREVPGSNPGRAILANLIE